MPRYAYRCKHCDHSFEKVHSMSEKLHDCPLCEVKDGLVRVPNKISKTTSKKKKVGDIVKQNIKDIKQEVKEEKEKMRKEEYKP